MTLKTLFAALAIALIASPVMAKNARHRAQTGCVDARTHFSLVEMLFSSGPEPQGNGCAPAVYDGGRYVGQDPDPNVRLELRRNPDNEGYRLNAK